MCLKRILCKDVQDALDQEIQAHDITKVLLDEYKEMSLEWEAQVAQLQARLHPKFNWTPPVSISGDDVNLVLLANLPHWGQVWRLPMDSGYRINTDEEMIEYIIWSDVDKCKYKPNFKDCDKFARKFWADYAWDTEYNNVGFVDDFSGTHAYILFVRRNNALWLYEPQNDRWWDTSEQEFAQPYPLESGVIVL